MIKSISIQNFINMNYLVNTIDIRSVQKFNDNHIPNAINIPKQALITNYNRYLDKNKVYYVYCQSGIQSIKVCKLLLALGYNVVNISGGYENWLLYK